MLDSIFSSVQFSNSARLGEILPIVAKNMKPSEKAWESTIGVPLISPAGALSLAELPLFESLRLKNVFCADDLSVMKNGLLVRVAIDSASGGWNGPCDDTGFCFVPMGDGKPTENYDRAYRPYRCSVEKFLPESAHRRTLWPTRLPERGHFDPDFEHLSYGDAGQRAKRLRSHLADGGFIVFYAGLRNVHTGKLCYSIIGFYEIDRVLSAPEVKRADRHRNAHTRGNGCSDDGAVVVFARPGSRSGRLRSHIPIGTYRKSPGRDTKVYRVTRKLLREWGGLDVRDGYIHRSVHLPAFRDPEKFWNWFWSQNPKFIKNNNPSQKQRARVQT